MSFIFSLQRVLEIREKIVHECELELENTKRALEALRQLLVEERNFYFREREELNESIRNAYIHKISLYENSLMSRQKKMIEILSFIRNLEQDMDLFEQNLIQAKRNLKIIENLRDKKLEQYKKIVHQKEKIFFDEQSILRFRSPDEYGFTD
ncbi:MAG: hypothetical protein K2X39_05510, partial [Silvanigrellaceae bacterium]|nr:hypothetical protein [Silvanigrellaceae bacterium]